MLNRFVVEINECILRRPSTLVMHLCQYWHQVSTQYHAHLLSHTGKICTSTNIPDHLMPCAVSVVNVTVLMNTRLKLALKEGLLTQQSVSDAVAVGQKAVGHFKQSALAYSHQEYTVRF